MSRPGRWDRGSLSSTVTVHLSPGDTRICRSLWDRYTDLPSGTWMPWLDSTMFSSSKTPCPWTGATKMKNAAVTTDRTEQRRRQPRHVNGGVVCSASLSRPFPCRAIPSDKLIVPMRGEHLVLNEVLAYTESRRSQCYRLLQSYLVLSLSFRVTSLLGSARTSTEWRGSDTGSGSVTPHRKLGKVCELRAGLAPPSRPPPFTAAALRMTSRHPLPVTSLP